MRLGPSTAFAASLLSFACGTDPRAPSNPQPNGPATVSSRSSLRDAFAEPDVDVVGIAIDPDNGTRYLLDANRGLYRLTDHGPELFAGLDRLVPLGDGIIESAFTDVAALGGGRFAMTALNDGFLFDAGLGTFTRYFCYVPGDIIDQFPEENVVQMTRSLTFDPASSLIYAQPQTFADNMDGEILTSQIGQFSLSGGEGFGWLDIDDREFIAGGIAMIGQGKMILGAESTLRTYDMSRADFTRTVQLHSLGVTQIDALTVDPTTGHLLIVDGADDELVEIELR